MGYLALYRKYRPQSLSDLVGQSEISSIIKNEILNNRISHAYLFSGPRGTGKTSTAKIVAKMVNCENLGEDGIPCGKCQSCINFSGSSDIIEIDAASNNGVDEIRDLRDKVNLVPSFGKYKVYIIDEVHMLTTQAFNALLKTLEEPPAHIIFILATTEFYKIPNTVVSRCQKFQFIRFSNQNIVDRLRYISNNENIEISDDILFEIARLSDGGLRDAINMLDQLSSFKNSDLQLNDLYRLNGVVSYNDFDKLIDYMIEKDTRSIVEFLEQIDQNGNDFGRFIDDFMVFIKDLLIYSYDSNFDCGISEKNSIFEKKSKQINSEQLYKIIFELNDLSVRMKNSSFSKILVISSFIKMSDLFNNFHSTTVENSISVKSVDNFTEKVSVSKKKNVNNIDLFKITDKEKKIRINNAFATASKDLKENFLREWSIVIEKASSDSQYVSIAGMLNDVKVMVVGEHNVIFVAQYDSLLERLFGEIQTIEHLLLDCFHNQFSVIFLMIDEWNYEKDKYVSSLKSGKKYEYIDSGLKDTNINSDEDIDKLVSYLGENVISYEN